MVALCDRRAAVAANPCEHARPHGGSALVGLSICSKKHSMHSGKGRPLNMLEGTFKALNYGLSICSKAIKALNWRSVSLGARKHSRH